MKIKLLLGLRVLEKLSLGGNDIRGVRVGILKAAIRKHDGAGVLERWLRG